MAPAEPSSPERQASLKDTESPRGEAISAVHFVAMTVDNMERGQASHPVPGQEIVWLSTQDAARRLGVTPRTLYRFIDEGQLPAYRFGRVIRLQLSEVHDFIERCRIQPGSLEHLYPESVGPAVPRASPNSGQRVRRAARAPAASVGGHAAGSTSGGESFDAGERHPRSTSSSPATT